MTEHKKQKLFNLATELYAQERDKMGMASIPYAFMESSLQFLVVSMDIRATRIIKRKLTEAVLEYEAGHD